MQITCKEIAIQYFLPLEAQMMLDDIHWLMIGC